MPRSPVVCATPGCPNLTPCPTHPPKQRWTGSTRKQRRPGSGWEEQRRHQRILKRDKRCYLCGAQATQVDHVISTAEGGSWTDPTNLAPICAPCHDAKTKAEAARARARSR